jgi:hypothetical protein
MLAALAIIPVGLVIVYVGNAYFFPGTSLTFGPTGELLLVTVLALEGIIAISEFTHNQLSGRRERQERAAQIANTFFSTDFRVVRKTAWTLRRHIVQDKRFADALATQWILDEKNPDQEVQAVLDETATPFSQIIEFYLFVFSIYKELDEPGDGEFKRVLDKYRYPFWRGAIILARDACHTIYRETIEPEPELAVQFPCPSIISEITQLDSKYSDTRYSYESHPIDNIEVKRRLLQKAGRRPVGP